MGRSLLRVLAMVVMVGLPVAAIFTHEARLVPFLAMPLFVLGGPMLAAAARRREDDAGDDEGDDSDGGGGGGNRRPDRGPLTPSGPTGRLPMETSSPGRWRLRGRERERVSDPGHRRAPHRPPERRPRRVPARPRTR